MVNAHLEDGSFSPSEVYYYTRDYIGVEGTPLVHCYDAVFSGELQRYHVLLDDLSETHVEAEKKTPTLEYGLALAEGLAVLHARWWGAQRFTEAGATMHSAEHLLRFVDIAESGVENVIDHFSSELEPHWPAAIRALYAQHPQTMIKRTKDDHGFTLVHGDLGHKNILVPNTGDRPIYIIDRQPFDWALTTWLGVYDLAYAMVLDWETETRRHLEMPILRNYYDHLIKNGVTGYSWEQLYEDYKLCVAMGVYVATEYFRGGVNSPWVSTWLLMLRRALTACDDLKCNEHW
jgi:aminoglycoside/choline kinase family phosphotransferase